ncbi:MAG: glutathione S-transferase family protein [Alphaproteobacteria bacterium]
MYRLYGFPGTSSMAPHAVLEEIGAAYEVVPVDIRKPRDPAYLRLNPTGQVPTLVDDGTVVYEAAAIVMYLVDRHPDCGLAPALGDPLRGMYYQWLLYMAATLQPAFKMHYYPERFTTDPGDEPKVQANVAGRLDDIWTKIDNALAAGPYVLGQRFSACDIYLQMLTTWRAEPQKPISAYPNVARCAERVSERPAVARMLKAHGLA